MLMENLGGQTKSIMVFSEVAYTRIKHGNNNIIIVMIIMRRTRECMLN